MLNLPCISRLNLFAYSHHFVNRMEIYITQAFDVHGVNNVIPTGTHCMAEPSSIETEINAEIWQTIGQIPERLTQMRGEMLVGSEY